MGNENDAQAACATASREQIIAEAMTFLGTPYHLGGQVKGAGVDCATFIYKTFHTFGMMPTQDIGVFHSDWPCHTKDEVYIRRLLRHATKIADGISYASLRTKSANIALVKTDENSKVYNHGGIILAWPKVIHCAPENGVEIVDASLHWLWSFKKVMIFDPWEKQSDGTS